MSIVDEMENKLKQRIDIEFTKASLGVEMMISNQTDREIEQQVVR